MTLAVTLTVAMIALCLASGFSLGVYARDRSWSARRSIVLAVLAALPWAAAYLLAYDLFGASRLMLLSPVVGLLAAALACRRAVEQHPEPASPLDTHHSIPLGPHGSGR